MTENTFFNDYKTLLNSIDTLAKTKEGYGYQYLELAPLMEIVQPKLFENNFILVQTVQQAAGSFVRDTKEPAIHENKESRSRVVEGIIEKHIDTPAYVLHSELIHSSGKVISCDMPLYVDDIDPQAIGSAETYMRRYSIYSLLHIRVKDDDGVAGSAKGKANQKSHAEKPQLPENPADIATFLVNQENPKIYYQAIKARTDIDPTLRKKLNNIMYPQN